VNDNEAADVVQDVLLLLHTKMSEFRYNPDQRFRGWLRTVTLNKCRDHFRKRARGMPTAESGEIRRLEVEDDAEIFTDDEYRKHVASRALQLMKSDFQETTWQACWLRIVEERPAAEIAAELNMTENAVYVAFWRVIRRLREELQGLLD
jgi:RNA polymerase sigma-70 factor (ECF subfamily)